MTFCQLRLWHSCFSTILYLLSWLSLSGMTELAGTFTHTWKLLSAITKSKENTKLPCFKIKKRFWHFICNQFKYNTSIRSIKYILIDQVLLCTSSVIVYIQSCSVKIRSHLFLSQQKTKHFPELDFDRYSENIMTLPVDTL